MNRLPLYKQPVSIEKVLPPKYSHSDRERPAPGQRTTAGVPWDAVRLTAGPEYPGSVRAKTFPVEPMTPVTPVLAAWRTGTPLSMARRMAERK